MGDHENPKVCLSEFEHGSHVLDVLVHYFGCLREEKRNEYLKSLQPHKQKRIEIEKNRIRDQRVLFESEQDTKHLVAMFKMSLHRYLNRQQTANQEPINKPEKPSAANGYGMNAYALFFRESEGYSDSTCFEEFPNQKLPLKDLLYNKDKKTNPLMRDCEENEIRYFHLPANNMDWVEVFFTNSAFSFVVF
jgi:hypothetical protein